MTTGRYARRITEVPPGRHWAILSDRTIEIPKDEQTSKAGATVESVMNYRVFTNEREFREQLQVEMEEGKTVLGMEISGVYQAQVTTTFKKVE